MTETLTRPETTASPKADSLTASYADWSVATKEAALIVPTHPSIPILSFAFARCEDERIVLESTDLEVSNIRHFPGSGSGVIPIPVHSLKSALKAIRGTVTARKAAVEPIILAWLDDEHFSVFGFGHALTIDADRPNLNDWPALPSMSATENRITVDAGDWSSAFSFAAAAAGNDWTLPMLLGVRVGVESGSVEMAATDRYRLSVYPLPEASSAGDWHALIPAKRAAKLFADLAGKLTVSLTSPDMIRVDHEQGTLYLWTLEATFPSYRSLIPSEGHAYSVERKCLIADLQAARAVNSDKVVIVDFAPGSVQVEGSQPIPACGSTEFFHAAFNVDRLIAGLKAFDCEHVTLTGKASNKPWLVSDSANDGRSSLYLIMTIRLPD